MRARTLPILAAMAVFWLATPTPAATWSLVDTSGFTASPPSQLTDWTRLMFHSVAVDGAGNIYTTANNKNNRGASGGITIYPTGGGKIDVDLNSLGYPGAVTKLVNAGGNIYALSNYRAIWDTLGGATYAGEGYGDKILRIDADGAVTKIYECPNFQDGWIRQVQTTSAETANLDVDPILEPGNKCWQITHVATKNDQYYKATKDSACTLAARFKVSAYTPGTNRTALFQLVGGGATTSPYVYVVLDQTDSHLKLLLWTNKEVLLDMGLVDTNAWNTMYLYVNALTGDWKINWNGTVTSGTVTDPAKLGGGTTGWAQWGAATDAANQGTSTVLFDWVGYGRGDIASWPSGNSIAYNDFSPVYYDPPANTIMIWNGGAKQCNNRMNGLAVGSDGNLYWTSGGFGSYYRNHFFWRYNVASSTVEEAPQSALNPPVAPAVTNGADEGMSENYLCNAVDYIGQAIQTPIVSYTAGVPSYGTPAVMDQFADLWESDAQWSIDPVGWGVKKVRGTLMSGLWGRRYHTASAYDAARGKFWATGVASNAATAYWAQTATNGTGGSGAAAVIVDLGSGNKGYTAKKPVENGSQYWNWAYTDNGVKQNAYTLAMQFKLDSYTSCTTAAAECIGNQFIYLRPWCPTSGTDYVAPASLGVNRVDEGGGNYYDHYQLITRGGSPTANFVLKDLGRIDAGTGTWHVVYLYCENSRVSGSSTTHIKLWWDGTLYDIAVDCLTMGITGNASSYSTIGCNAAGPYGLGAIVSANQITWDWWGAGRGTLSPGNPSNKWDFYFDGAYLPQALGAQTSIATLYTGPWGGTGLYNDPANPGTNATLTFQHFHVNNNNPQVLDNVRTLGTYWVNCLAISPADGRAWMSYGGEATYTYGDLGRVFTRDLGLNYSDEGVPESGAIVTALAFSNGKAYAATCNLTTGVYKLYSAPAPASLGTQSLSAMKKDWAGSFVETDVPKVVTYADNISGWGQFFYIQDSNNPAGIRVLLGPTDTLPSRGDKVKVTGMLDVVSGEAVINHATVEVMTQENPDPKSLGVTVKATGGKQLGPQPATNPAYGLTNVGLLVRIAGKVKAIQNVAGGADDLFGVIVSSRSWFTIDDGTGATTSYYDISSPSVKKTVPGLMISADPGTLAVDDMVEVTGVAGLYFSYMTGTPATTYSIPGQRMIFVRDANDIRKYLP